MNAADSGTIQYAGKTVPRMGFGAMRLLGPRLSEPVDRPGALAVLRRAVELGVRVIDTAWYYGHDVSNALIAEALQPYPEDLVLATKLGARLVSGNRPTSAVHPDQLREGNDRDRRVLGLDTVPLTHLRWPGGTAPVDGVSFEQAFETMLDMHAEGRIRHIGLSNVTLSQLAWAHTHSRIASVSNVFSFSNQSGADVLDFCEKEGIPYLPWGPLEFGDGVQDGQLDRVSDQIAATPAQVRLAWLLARSAVVIPIPGTGSLAHLEENIAAGAIPTEAVAGLR